MYKLIAIQDAQDLPDSSVIQEIFSAISDPIQRANHLVRYGVSVFNLEVFQTADALITWLAEAKTNNCLSSFSSWDETVSLGKTIVAVVHYGTDGCQPKHGRWLSLTEMLPYYRSPQNSAAVDICMGCQRTGYRNVLTEMGVFNNSKLQLLKRFVLNAIESKNYRLATIILYRMAGMELPPGFDASQVNGMDIPRADELGFTSLLPSHFAPVAFKALFHTGRDDHFPLFRKLLTYSAILGSFVYDESDLFLSSNTFALPDMMRKLEVFISDAFNIQMTGLHLSVLTLPDRTSELVKMGVSVALRLYEEEIVGKHKTQIHQDFWHLAPFYVSPTVRYQFAFPKSGTRVECVLETLLFNSFTYPGIQVEKLIWLAIIRGRLAAFPDILSDVINQLSDSAQRLLTQPIAKFGVGLTDIPQGAIRCLNLLARATAAHFENNLADQEQIQEKLVAIRQDETAFNSLDVSGKIVFLLAFQVLIRPSSKIVKISLVSGPDIVVTSENINSELDRMLPGRGNAYLSIGLKLDLKRFRPVRVVDPAETIL